MRIESLLPGHVPDFLNLAGKEGWICEGWEFEFVLKNFPQGCLIAIINGIPVGFITSARYGTSGWIGNLLVREDLRGQGLGRALFKQALAALDRSGAETIWLTASPAGQPLYEKLGFVARDRIIRWRGSGGDSGQKEGQPACPPAAMEKFDRMGWGDSRLEILMATAARGIVIGVADGFCTLQMSVNGLQLGPWGCNSKVIAEALLGKALQARGPWAEIFLDVPEANREADQLLRKHGFRQCGATTLMYRGKCPTYRPEHIYALATMGSLG